MSYSENTKLGELLKDERTKALLEKWSPGITSHPQLALGKGMPIKTIAGFPQSGFTPDNFVGFLAELTALE